MKNLGYLLITVGFLTGAYAASQTADDEIETGLFLGGFAAGLIGVVLARVGAHRESSHADTVQTGYEAVSTSLDRLIERLTALDAEKDGIDPYVVHERIDELFPDDLAQFADGRQSIAKLHGLTAYAEVMNDFAAGERYLNRVWSASIDGYIDEVQEYLGRSLSQFVAARATLTRLGSAG